ncbi:MAG: DUF5058 family protein [Clostridiales bacterium]|nr:DUF5058 family protein [Clostridiales bacterium]
MYFNTGPIYLIVGIVIATVCAQAIFFLVKAYREGLRIGMTKETLNKAVVSSAVFSVLPSTGILATMFGLIKYLGIPFSWLRLSVIGSLMYELTAADAAAQQATGKALSSAEITPEIFVTIAIVMSVGIILGEILCIIGLKKYSEILKKPRNKTAADINADNERVGPETWNASDFKTSETVAKKKKADLGEIGGVVTAAVFIALCGAYIGGAIGEAFGGFHIDSYTSVIPFISMLVSVGCMAILYHMQKKRAWLKSFSLSISMLVGMVSAVPASLVLGTIFGA